MVKRRYLGKIAAVRAPGCGWASTFNWDERGANLVRQSRHVASRDADFPNWHEIFRSRAQTGLCHLIMGGHHRSLGPPARPRRARTYWGDGLESGPNDPNRAMDCRRKPARADAHSQNRVRARGHKPPGNGPASGGVGTTLLQQRVYVQRRRQGWGLSGAMRRLACPPSIPSFHSIPFHSFFHSGDR